MAEISCFAKASLIPKDAIFALTAQYNEDDFPQKVNLGQGAYRDENGQPWILPSVAESRARLNQAGLQHEYLPILGLAEFRSGATRMVLGDGILAQNRNKIASCQSISGTGALHLAGLALKRCSTFSRHVYIPEPTWSNHHQLFSALGFECHSFQYYNAATKSLDLDSYSQALESAEEGSIIILHACAQNPTGCDPTQEEWRQIGHLVKSRRLFPLFDAAYLGFNSGNYENDAFAIRYFVNDLGLETGICLSFAKNMGLYGERVGCTVFVTSDSQTAQNLESNLEALQRSEVSNPPAFGAKIASTILNNEELRKMWFEDLITMSSRIRCMREALYEYLNQYGNWDHLLRQSGMFGFLGLNRDVVLDLRSRFHIYMADNSRISIAGLNESNVEYVAKSIADSLSDHQRNHSIVAKSENSLSSARL